MAEILPETLTGVLAAHSRTRAGRSAYVYLEEGEREADSITFEALDRRSSELASALVRRAPRGARVILVFPTGIDFVVAFYACAYAGMVAVPAFSPSSRTQNRGRLEAIRSSCDARILLTTREHHGALDSAMMGSGLDVIAIEDLALDSPAGDTQLPEITARDTLFLQYTSGSTSSPKGVVVSHRNLLSNLELMRDAYGHTSESDFVQWVPLYHDLGLIGHMLQTVYLGSTCFMMTPEAFVRQPIRWLRAIARYGARASMAPNFSFALCVRHVTADQAADAQLDLSSWKVAAIGAEPIRASTMSDFVDRFGPFGFERTSFYGTYGLAEGTLILAADRHDAARPNLLAVDREALTRGEIVRPTTDDGQILVSSGQVGRGHEVAVVDPTTRRRCRRGVVGELWFTGASVAEGYLDDPDRTRSTFENEIEGEPPGAYLRTGDLGFVDDEQIYVTGRLKEVLILNGVNYYPQDIEVATYQSHETLRPGCCAAFSVDADGAEGVVVVQELSRAAASDFDGPDLCKIIRRAVLAVVGIQLARVVLIAPSTLPKTTSGKIQRLRARDLYMQQELKTLYVESDRAGVTRDEPTSGPDRMEGPSVREVSNWLLFRIAQSAGIAVSEISLQDEVTQYFADSIDIVRMMDDLGRSLGIDLDPAIVVLTDSIGELAEVVCDPEALAEAQRGTRTPVQDDIVEGGV